MDSLKDCKSIKRLAIPIHTTFGDFETENSFKRYPASYKYLPPQLKLTYSISCRPVRVSPRGSVTSSHGAWADHSKDRLLEGLLRRWELIENRDAYVPDLKRVIWWFQQSSQDPGRGSEVRTIDRTPIWTCWSMHWRGGREIQVDLDTPFEGYSVRQRNIRVVEDGSD